MVVEGIEGRAGSRLVVWLWWSVCALSLLLIALTLAFHLTTRYDWWFGGTFQPWRMFVVEAIAALGAPILGALIVWRQPDNRYGWIWCLLGLGMALRGAAYAYEIWALYVAPYQPGGLEAAWVGTVMDALNWGLVPLLLLLFPDGRPPSPRWRPVVWVAVAACAVSTLSAAVAPGEMDDGTPNPIRWLHGAPGEVARALALGLWRPTLLLMAVGALSLLARYRRADGRQRLQIKWLAYVAVPLFASFIVQLRWDLIGLLGAAYTAAASWAIYVAIGIAVLRHHLYDIDRLINRTVVYGLLTAGGVAVYVLVVKLAEWLLHEGVGLGGSLVATAVIAVGFAPARDRLQRWVDRRLYGERHDPVQAMVRLGERLRDAPRGAADGDVLAGVLQAVCEALRLPSASLRVAGAGLPVLPAAVEVATYRIITEALTNVVRHARAHQVAITIAVDADLCLSVDDDGVAPTANGDGWRPGLGLQSMVERAVELGGTLQAGPTRTGGRVEARLPLELP